MKFEGIKYAAFDLDGTILDEKGKLFDGVNQGIKLLVSKSITPIIITGRTYDSFRGLRLEKEFLKMFNDIVILNDGNVFFHRGTGSLTIKSVLSSMLFPFIYSLLHDKAEFVIEADGKHYASNRQAVLKYSMIYMVPRNYIHVVNFNQQNFGGITNIFVFPPDKIDLSMLTKRFACNVAYIDYLNTVVITPSNTCKAVALKKHLREHFDETSLQHIVAFGDGYNDRNMLRNCKIGIAVEKSHKDAVEHCDYHLDQPIGKFLHKTFK
ncbi:HAD hydrolase family protein [Bacillus cereus group sp. N21]|nr:HAD hydrolase family protein [Bacillus cereus group sp. N21]